MGGALGALRVRNELERSLDVEMRRKEKRVRYQQSKGGISSKSV
jgi:hypothetical protein